MGEERRCKKCNKPIDEGTLCSKCRKPEIFGVFGVSQSELKEMKRQGELYVARHADRVKDVIKNH